MHGSIDNTRGKEAMLPNLTFLVKCMSESDPFTRTSKYGTRDTDPCINWTEGLSSKGVNVDLDVMCRLCEVRHCQWCKNQWGVAHHLPVLTLDCSASQKLCFMPHGASSQLKRQEACGVAEERKKVFCYNFLTIFLILQASKCLPVRVAVMVWYLRSSGRGNAVIRSRNR